PRPRPETNDEHLLPNRRQARAALPRAVDRRDAAFLWRGGVSVRRAARSRTRRRRIGLGAVRRERAPAGDDRRVAGGGMRRRRSGTGEIGPVAPRFVQAPFPWSCFPWSCSVADAVGKRVPEGDVTPARLRGRQAQRIEVGLRT